MLFPISVALALLCQTGPEAAVGGGRVIWKLAAGTADVAVVYQFALDLKAGEHTLIWRPGADEPKPDAVEIRIEPAAAASVVASAVSPREARWKVSVPRAGRFEIAVEARATGLKWSLAATGRLDGVRLVWQPLLVIENSTDRLARADGLVVVSAAGKAKEIPEAVQVPAKGRAALPLGHPWTWEGLVVHRYTAADGRVRRVMKIAASAAAQALAPLGVTELAIAGTEAGQRFVVRTSAERGAEVDLGPSNIVAVRRVLMDERREALDYDRFGRVQGYDTVEDYFVEVINLAEQPAAVEIWEEMTSAWEMKSSPPPDLTFPDAAVLRLKLLGGQRATLRYSIIKHSGSRVPQ